MLDDVTIKFGSVLAGDGLEDGVQPVATRMSDWCSGALVLVMYGRGLAPNGAVGAQMAISYGGRIVLRWGRGKSVVVRIFAFGSPPMDPPR